MTKWCNKCKRELPKSSFCADNTKPGGLSSNCRQCRAAMRKLNKINNKDRYKKGWNKWRNKNKDKMAEYTREWRARGDNSKKASIHAINYHYAKMERVPKWADLKAMKEFYDNCPEGHQVDHIIPLQGKLVSGLHVMENLQYLPSIENSSKGNKFDPETFEV